jgi:hypothetical protein
MVSYGDRVEKRQVYYTGKNINATSGSRTDISAAIAVGDVLIEDPHDHEGYGKGNVVTEAQTSYLDQPAWVVDSIPAGNEQAGWITVKRGKGIDAKCHANITSFTTYLGVANADRGLVAVSGVASFAAIFTAKGLGRVTHDSSSTAAIKAVDFWGGRP